MAVIERNNGVAGASQSLSSLLVPVKFATADPTSGDDIGDGYADGHVWIRTDTNDLFICLDNSLAAADWWCTTRITQNSDSGDHDLVIADKDADLTITHASGADLTFPQDSDEDIPIGSSGLVTQGGAGAITCVEGTGATIVPTGTITTNGEDTTIGWEKIAADTFKIVGDMVVS